MRFSLQILLFLIVVLTVLLVLSVLFQRRGVRRRTLVLGSPELPGSLPAGAVPLAVSPLEDWRPIPDRIGEERGRDDRLLTLYEAEASVGKWVQEILLTELARAAYDVVAVADARADQRLPVVSGQILTVLIRPDLRQLTVSLALRVTHDGVELHRRRYEQVRPAGARFATQERWSAALQEAVRDVCAAFADEIAPLITPLSSDDRDSDADLNTPAALAGGEAGGREESSLPPAAGNADAGE